MAKSKKGRTPKLKKDGTPKMSGGKRENAGRKLSYDAYVRKYKSKERKLAANSVAMAKPMYKESEFKAQYTRLKEQMIDDGKIPNNITDKLIDKQAYEFSEEQYKRVRENIDPIISKKYNYYQIRSGMALGQYEAEKYKKLKEDHPEISHEDAMRFARNSVSTEFFGSK